MEHNKNLPVGQASLPVPSGLLSKQEKPAQAGMPMLPQKHAISEFNLTERNLPHWQNPGSVYFVTFRTHNNLLLDDFSKQIIFDSILFHNEKKYNLYVFVIMNDHVHIILQPKEISNGKYFSLSEIMHSIKSFSAKKIKSHLVGQASLPVPSGLFSREEKAAQAGMPVLQEIIFQSESFDRIIRDNEELQEKMNYILNNPVKKELCKNGYEYKWYYYAK